MNTGVIPVGQTTGLIHDEPSVSELIDRIITEARAIQVSLAEKLS
jgi:hypothetical protein